MTGLDQRLLAERDTIRAVLGKNWRQAALLAGPPAYDDHRDRDQDGPQWDVVPVGGLEQAR